MGAASCSSICYSRSCGSPNCYSEFLIRFSHFLADGHGRRCRRGPGSSWPAAPVRQPHMPGPRRARSPAANPCRLRRCSPPRRHQLPSEEGRLRSALWLSRRSQETRAQAKGREAAYSCGQEASKRRVPAHPPQDRRDLGSQVRRCPVHLCTPPDRCFCARRLVDISEMRAEERRQPREQNLTLECRSGYKGCC